jgi:hypothetical protein
MEKIDRKKFFDRYRETFGPLKQSQVDGLEALLGCMENDPDLQDKRWAAYMLATVQHECAGTWEPIEECGKGRGKAYGGVVFVEGDDGATHKCIYYGRGYVQLTWAENYFKMGRSLGVPLHVHPELALQPETAYRIMSHGMRNGSFTGKRLDHYIDKANCDYVSARKIINGLDRAEKIAEYARAFEAML